jgi:hypothetical protein
MATLLDLTNSQAFFRTSADLAVSLAVSLTGLAVNLAAVTAGIFSI